MPNLTRKQMVIGAIVIVAVIAFLAAFGVDTYGLND